MYSLGYSDRKKLWFGTAVGGGMDWFPTPLQGAEMSPEGWSTGGTLLNGGGYQQNSFGSHKTYTFEWPSSSSREAAALMKAYSDGTYGRGLIYFIDPLIYDKNILPAMWADPSMVLGYEGSSHVYGEIPDDLPTPGWKPNRLPVRSVRYDLRYSLRGFPGRENALFIPIPEGYSLLLGAIYSRTGWGGVFASWQDSNGVIQEPVRLTEVDAAGTHLLPDAALQGEGVWLWVGKSETGEGTVTLSAMSARLVPTGALLGAPASDGSVYGDGFYGQFVYGGELPGTVQKLLEGPWEPGMGHSGCRFIGKPTYIANTGVNGGQVSFAASFREVGSWTA